MNTPTTAARHFAKITRCPYTGAALEAVSRQRLLELLTPRGAERLPAEADSALVTRGGELAFPVAGRTACFLESDALPLRQGADMPAAPSSGEVREAVRSWYDDFGWQRTDSGELGDTGLFSQQGAAGHGLYEMSSHLRILDHLPGGTYLLDAASGALAHPEYRAYSWFYDYRVCVDLSITALGEVSARLGDHGLCLRADMKRLPFPDGLFQGAVSGYTLQHIDAADQEAALAELVRVLAGGSSLSILTNVAPGPAGRLLHGLLRRWPGGDAQSDSTAEKVQPPSTLYCHLRPTAWWRRAGRRAGGRVFLRTLRLLRKDEFEKVFGSSTPAARRLGFLERLFPRLLRPFAEYLWVRIDKSR
ncbi:MAG: class I SAM-dependent methyltransferase [Acidobacteriota bacterium]